MLLLLYVVNTQHFIVYSFAKIWSTFIHINENIVYEIPILNRILMDPKSHHLHHARNAIYIDKNFCETFILYDVLFKTYVKQTENPIYGSFNNPIPKGFWDVQLNEFRLLKKDIKESKSLLETIKFIFYPPGWKP
ncbi:MAG: sterol desaturase family protein [Saprospiraceae bacterium]|nr:sterol desaturase family protein [Saprospiraceae bacterium]